MTPNNSNCATKGNDSKVKFHENLSTMYVDNRKREAYTKIKIDGCDITTGNKCDDGIILHKTGETLLVELKGSDIDHAVKQLSATLTNYALSRRKNVKCFIISSNNPNSSTKTQLTKASFIKHTGVQLFIEKPNFTYSYT